MGYSAKDKRPFEVISIVVDAEKDINQYLHLPENQDYLKITEKTKNFLSGFYSPFGLELLSTIDFIMQHHQITDPDEIRQKLNNWGNRKKTLFDNPKFVTIATEQLRSYVP